MWGVWRGVAAAKRVHAVHGDAVAPDVCGWRAPGDDARTPRPPSQTRAPLAARTTPSCLNVDDDVCVCMKPEEGYRYRHSSVSMCVVT